MLLAVLLWGCGETCEIETLGPNCSPVEACCGPGAECYYRFQGVNYDCSDDGGDCYLLTCRACEYTTEADEAFCADIEG